MQVQTHAQGPAHLDVALCCYNLAIVCQKQGKVARAARLYTRCLRIRERRLGRRHPDVCAPCLGLAGAQCRPPAAPPLPKPRTNQEDSKHSASLAPLRPWKNAGETRRNFRNLGPKVRRNH